MTLDTWRPLSKFDQTYVRPDHFAVISAGYKDASGKPVASRDGIIYVADPENRAEGLRRILASTGGRVLTVAVPSNNPADFISDTYRCEAASRLEAFGDDGGITEIRADGNRFFHAFGTPEFRSWRARSKVVTNITLLLADYDENGRPRLLFPDGVGTYRLRTTSANTSGNLMATLRTLAKMTGGQVAGFPLEMRIVQRELSDPTGKKRRAPVFVFALKPPGGVVLDGPNHGWKALAGTAMSLTQTTILELPAHVSPEEDTDMLALPEYARLVDPDMGPEKFRQAFFGMVQGTWAAEDDARASLLSEFSKGAFRSLGLAAQEWGPERMEAFLQFVRERLNEEPNPETGEVVTVAEVISAAIEYLANPDPEPPFDPKPFVKALQGKLRAFGCKTAKEVADAQESIKRRLGVTESSEITPQMWVWLLDEVMEGHLSWLNYLQNPSWVESFQAWNENPF